uniref:Uncharacterized protein n=1 Tax=viral metagenome TaxID=1070528 RepID=A0A6C0IWI6_9ZZZZ
MYSTRKSSRIQQQKVLKETTLRVSRFTKKTPEKKVPKKKKSKNTDCFMLLYKCSENTQTLIPIYIDEELGDTFINNMDLIKEIDGASLQYAKKCCKEVYNYMNNMNAIIHPELTKKLFDLLSTNSKKMLNNLIPEFDAINDVNNVYVKETKMVVSVNTCVFDFNWDMDELTKLSEMENDREDECNEKENAGYESEDDYLYEKRWQ